VTPSSPAPIAPALPAPPAVAGTSGTDWHTQADTSGRSDAAHRPQLRHTGAADRPGGGGRCRGRRHGDGPAAAHDADDAGRHGRGRSSWTADEGVEVLVGPDRAVGAQDDRRGGQGRHDRAGAETSRRCLGRRQRNRGGHLVG